jgi:hypothetical protein
MKRRFVFFLVTITAVLFSGCVPDDNSGSGSGSNSGSGSGDNSGSSSIHPLGVWWWNADLILNPQYLDFAAQNHVDEIYLARPDHSVQDFGPEIEAFIEQAKRKGIKVYLLLGFGYITYDYPRLRDALLLYGEYQTRVPDGRRFDGIHLDIEFHVDHPDWSNTDKHADILAEYLDLIVQLRSEISGIMEIDIPAWFDQILSYDGTERPLYQILIDTVDRVFVMSYRDTAEAMYEIASEEVAYARQTNKPIMLGAELGEDEEWDHVSYFEEGRLYLYEQLKLLKDVVNYSKAGASIHHMKTWYELHD